MFILSFTMPPFDNELSGKFTTMLQIEEFLKHHQHAIDRDSIKTSRGKQAHYLYEKKTPSPKGEG